MTCEFYHLPHEGIKSLSPYVPGKSIEDVTREQGITEIIKLASNENPLGCSPHVLHALKHFTSAQVSIYPTSINHPLRYKLADFVGVDTDMITLSNGSDLLFCLLLMCFGLHLDKHILIHDYAFSSYAIQAKGLGIPVKSVPIQSNWSVNIQEIISVANKQTALIFLANPNNPTGLFIEHTNIVSLLESIPESTLLVLDEAYFEYASQTNPTNAISLLAKYPNLVITRTFSKAYGLAGLRLGYAIAHPHITNLLYRMQLPFAVNQAAIQAAMIALDDTEFLVKTLKITTAGIQQLQHGLDQLNLTYLPTHANFLMIDGKMDVNSIYQTLQQYGIIVRPLHAYGLNNYLRVTVGTKDQNQQFLDKLALCVQTTS